MTASLATTLGAIGLLGMALMMRNVFTQLHS